MSAHPETAEEHEVHVQQPPQGFIWKYVFSTDHKVIGKQYFFLALVAVVVGLTLSLIFRWHLMKSSQLAADLAHKVINQAQ